eukprot:CAMPEP_0197434226 /NCGR_PEP_ID=MMETSP1175-20131217/1978_1 /TAXON_ID=1003142 /ORGANISM="Triceratium dubium, Strain CCMP147" /LENGTH=90 /DNA_ID=CAMNT_0042962861 /DNA_START=221 /DNA_END=490 /DNA_ORIENTATION=+
MGLGLDLPDAAFPGSLVPAQAIVINNRIPEGIKYRDAHRPCPFGDGGSGVVTPSPELLAGRSQRGIRRSSREALASGRKLSLVNPNESGW